MASCEQSCGASHGKGEMIPDHLFDALARGARAAVLDAWLHASRMKSGKPDEVDHIYAMTTHGVRSIGANWSPVLQAAGISLRVTGVFCHQTPKSHYQHPTDGKKCPELGDLLMVHEHKTTPPNRQGQIAKRAVLVQAKVVDQGVPLSGAVDQYQEYLYEHWPDFVLRGRGTGATRFLPGPRNFRPDMETGRYGLIERDWPAHQVRHLWPFCSGIPWSCSEPRKPVRSAGGEDMGTFVANMLYDTGRLRGRITLPPAMPLSLMGSPNNHFDVTVEELLTLTAAKTLRFRNRGHVSGLRGNSVVACFQEQFGGAGMLPDTGSRFAPTVIRFDEDFDGAPPEDTSKPEPDDGMPIVLVETGSEAD